MNQLYETVRITPRIREVWIFPVPTKHTYNHSIPIQKTHTGMALQCLRSAGPKQRNESYRQCAHEERESVSMSVWTVIRLV